MAIFSFNVNMQGAEESSIKFSMYGKVIMHQVIINNLMLMSKNLLSILSVTQCKTYEIYTYSIIPLGTSLTHKFVNIVYEHRNFHKVQFGICYMSIHIPGSICMRNPSHIHYHFWISQKAQGWWSSIIQIWNKHVIIVHENIILCRLLCKVILACNWNN